MTRNIGDAAWSLGRSCGVVNSYPVTANLGPCLLTVPVKNYEVRLLPWHMAINAVASNLVTRPWEHHGSGLMATQTTLRKLCQVMLAGVNVVASQARHGRRLKTAAFLKQFDLAAVYINLRLRIGLRQFEVLVERFAGEIRKGSDKRRPLASMAPGTEIHLSVTRKSCGV